MVGFVSLISRKHSSSSPDRAQPQPVKANTRFALNIDNSSSCFNCDDVGRRQKSTVDSVVLRRSAGESSAKTDVVYG